MKLFSSSSLTGIILAACTFFVSLIISLFSYRYLWEHADKGFLVAWLVVFEASQLLLLLDLGFTHAFIRNFRGGAQVSTIVDSLPSLRTVLTISGVVALAASLLISYLTLHGKDLFPFILLALSVLTTIASYADTAALRILERHYAVYGANIFGGLVYLGVLFVSGLEVELAISVACISRACVQLIVQNILLGGGMTYGPPRFSSFGGEVVVLNLSYFLLFMLDGFFFSLMGFQSAALAVLLLNKKMYDVLRGFWDSILQVLSVDYTKRENAGRDILVHIFIALSFVVAYFMSEKVLTVWLGDFSYNRELSMSLCLSTMGLALYRNQSMKAYFQDQKGVYAFAIFAILIKIIFFFILYMGGEGVITYAYIGQALLMVFLVFTSSRLFFK